MAAAPSGQSGQSEIPILVSWRIPDTGVFCFLWSVRTLADGRATWPRVPAGHGSAEARKPVEELEAALNQEGVFRDDFSAALAVTTQPARLCLLRDAPSEGLMKLLGADAEIRMGPFAQAARAFGPGDDRRLLQLSVQYLSTDGVADDVAAAPVDKELLSEMREHLGLRDEKDS